MDTTLVDTPEMSVARSALYAEVLRTMVWASEQGPTCRELDLLERLKRLDDVADAFAQAAIRSAWVGVT